MKYGKLNAQQLFSMTISSATLEKNPDKIENRVDEVLMHFDIDPRMFKIKILKPSDKDPKMQRCVERMLDINKLKKFYKRKYNIVDGSLDEEDELDTAVEMNQAL